MTKGATVKRVGIAIDPWKLPIFERHLKQSGYLFETVKAHDDMMLLKVETENVPALVIVIKAANSEAARTGKPH